VSEQSTRAPLLCPSAPPEEGALVIGVRGPGGRLAHIVPSLPASTALANEAEAGTRLRFASPCAESSCGHWTGSSCGVIGQLVADAPPAAGSRLPQCGIRSSCRWFAEAGGEACARCALVVTDQTVLRATPRVQPAARKVRVRDHEPTVARTKEPAPKRS
jgi:hypothetical protein